MSSASAKNQAPRSIEHARRAAIWVAAALIILVVLPSLLANIVTGPYQPTGSKILPQHTWSLVTNVIREAPSASAANPGRALTLARATWTSAAGFREHRTHLVYITEAYPVTVQIMSGELVSLKAPITLAWVIEGKHRDHNNSTQILGAIDYHSGMLLTPQGTNQ